MEVKTEAKVILTVTLDSAEDIQTFVMALEYVRGNCAWQSPVEFSERLLAKLVEQGF